MISQNQFSLFLWSQVDANKLLQFAVFVLKLLESRRSFVLGSKVVVANESPFSIFSLFRSNTPTPVQYLNVGQTGDDKLASFMLRRITFVPQRPILNTQILQ